MKYIFLLFLLVIPLLATQNSKKDNFFTLLVAPIQDVYSELQEEYLSIREDIKFSKNNKKIKLLKQIYRVSTDKELLIALKPHPPSIALAQAAMESGWATSRFFKEANNVFGMWSINTYEQRIAAKEKRNGIQTIWMKKFTTIKESIRAYYKTLARAKAYKKFREYRYKTQDVFLIIQGLDKYSEMGNGYVQALSKVIKYNKLQKYDTIP